MADDYNDRQRDRENAAREAEGELPQVSDDAYLMAALGELAKRIGLGYVVSDAISDGIAGAFIEDGLSPSDDWDEWLARYAEVEGHAERLTDAELLARMGKHIEVVP
jgi:hypothetical protein